MAEEYDLTCEVCGYHNLQGALLCAHCGALLEPPVRGSDTRTFDEPPTDEAFHSPDATLIRGTRTFRPETILILDFGVGGQQQTLRVEDTVKIGRADRKTSSLIDLDLSAMGGWERGVSRLHAMIRRDLNRLNIIDLDSANGTWLNGELLRPKLPYPLHDGDRVRLGLLEFQIFFDNSGLSG